MMGLLGAAIRDNHLNDTDAVEESAITILVGVTHADVGDDNTLAIVEANVHFVSRPRQLIASNLERHTLGLRDIDRFQLVMLVLVANKLGEVVVLGHGHGGPLAIDITDVNTEDLLALGVGNDGEVERMGVLVVECTVAVVGQTLLQTTLEAPALVNTDGPGVKEDLGHIGDAKTLTSLDNPGIISSDPLHHIQVFEG